MDTSHEKKKRKSSTRKDAYAKRAAKGKLPADGSLASGWELHKSQAGVEYASHKQASGNGPTVGHGTDTRHAVQLATGPSETNRRQREWELKRERALKIHASDPELSFRDIAKRIGARHEQVSAWCKGTTRGEQQRGRRVEATAATETA